MKLLPSSGQILILGNKEIKSKEGATQSYPTTMAAYALGVAPLIHFLHEYVSINNYWCKKVAFADDFTTSGKIKGIISYWELLYFMVIFQNHLNLI